MAFWDTVLNSGVQGVTKNFQDQLDVWITLGFNRNSWRLRTKSQHMSDGFRIQNLDTWSAIEQEESKAGCRYSELLLLPYFDGPKMLVIDPMHNLFLGSAKHF